MSGPFTNTIQQLVEQLNWFGTNHYITWDNIRYGFDQQVVDGNGMKWVNFSPAFPRELIGVSATLDFSGGLRNWESGILNTSRFGFSVQTGIAGALAGWPTPPTIVGHYYLAWGR